MLRAAILSDPAALAPHVAAWDRMAVQLRRPYAAPAWMLAWWRHVAPEGATLAVVVVHDGEELVGVAPWYRRRTRSGLAVLRLLGTGHRVEPLAAPGREVEVAEAIVGALRSSGAPPGALRLDRADAVSPWPALLARGWPGRSSVDRRAPVTAPTLTMQGRTHDEWLASRSANFRSQRKRSRRKLGERGAAVRLVGPGDDLDAAVADFVRLHEARWTSRGERSGLAAGIPGMLREAAGEMVAGDRLRLWLLEAGDTAIAAQLFVVAGGEAAYWNGGFDPEWSDLRPAFETLAYAVEHSFHVGDARVDFGGGANPYKDRLADGDHPIGPVLIVPGGGDRVLREAQLLPERLMRGAVRLAERLPDDARQRVRSIVRR